MAGDDQDLVRITLPCRLKRAGGAVRITDPSGRPAGSRSEPDDTLIGALKEAHALLAGGEDIGRPEAASLQAAPACFYKRNVLRLAFLAPDIQSAILEGRQPAGFNRQRLVLKDIPPAWDDQRRTFGFP